MNPIDANAKLTRTEIESIQLKRMKELLVRVYENVPFYHESFDNAGFDPYSFSSLDEMVNVPFTVKQDLRDAYPFGMFAVPLSDVARVHASSGTSGKATVVGYTNDDITMWSECFARAMRAGNLDEHAIAQIAFGYGLFTGGFGATDGARLLGATVVPMGSGNTKRQLQIMKDFGVTVLACTPSYAVLIADTAYELGYDPKTDFKLEIAIVGAEPSSHSLRREIEEKLDCKVLDIYGLSEVMGPGVACECLEQNGMHVCEDYFYVEVVDPETGLPVPDGEFGELVFTSLKKDCSPVIRYRTKDISRILTGSCPCGSTHRRIDYIQGRADDMLIIRGVNVFPSHIEEVILGFKEVSPYYELVVSRKGAMDSVMLRVEPSESFQIDEMGTIVNLQNRIKNELKSVLQIAVDVKLVEPNSIERSTGKSNRIVDLRN